MAKVSFSETEKYICNLFKPGENIKFKGKNYKIILSEKPTCEKGEPKTDIYIKLSNKTHEEELKISVKQKNADFLENKISNKRAKEILGDQWEDIIKTSTNKLKAKFESRKLIYKSKTGRIEEGSITLGWKYEFVNKLSGELSEEIELNKEQIKDIYSGSNLNEEKRNAMVKNQKIQNSGIADYILIVEKENLKSSKEIIQNIIPIDKYIENKKMYFACKALNYRTKKNKYDGNRPLAVQIKWTINKGKLCPEFIFNNPLNDKFRGNNMAKQLESILEKMEINDTDDINENNVIDTNIIYENLK